MFLGGCTLSFFAKSQVSDFGAWFFNGGKACIYSGVNAAGKYKASFSNEGHSILVSHLTRPLFERFSRVQRAAQKISSAVFTFAEKT